MEKLTYPFVFFKSCDYKKCLCVYQNIFISLNKVNEKQGKIKIIRISEKIKEGKIGQNRKKERKKLK